MYKKKITNIVLLSIILLLSSCNMSEEEKRRLEEKNIKEFEQFYQEEQDPLFIKYKDSLEKYFSPLEIDLIKRYKNNHENLNSQEDFYYFYRNAFTLKKALSDKLKKHAQKIRALNGRLHPIDWFEELAEGMDIAIVHNNLTYEVFFDYQDFHDHADKTEGSADDDFIRLLEMSYLDHSFFPKWVKPISEYKGCSRLGSGLHYKVLELAQLCNEHNSLFKSQIQRVRKDVINDIFARRIFCSSIQKAVAEINKICNHLAISEVETKLLQKRSEQLLKNKNNMIKFGCVTEDCLN